MPLVPDYSPEDEEGDAPGGAPGGLIWGDRGGGGAPGGARQTEPSKQQDSGFVPWSRFVSANADVAKREAGELNDAVRGKVDAAQKAGDTAMDAFNNQIAGNYERAKSVDDKRTEKQNAKGGAAASSFMAGGRQLPQTPQAPQQPYAPPQLPADMSQRTAMPKPPPGPRPTLGYVAENTLAGPTAEAVANGPKGSKDLESMMGGDAWGKLLGDTVEAEAEAKALGSEGGVEALLQKGGASPNSAFDAALINGAAGSSFGDTTKAAEGLGDALGNRLAGSMSAWDRLTGDVGAAQAEKTAQDSQNKLIRDFAVQSAALGRGQKSKSGAAGPIVIGAAPTTLGASADFVDGSTILSGDAGGSTGFESNFLATGENQVSLMTDFGLADGSRGTWKDDDVLSAFNALVASLPPIDGNTWAQLSKMTAEERKAWLHDAMLKSGFTEDEYQALLTMTPAQQKVWLKQRDRKGG